MDDETVYDARIEDYEWIGIVYPHDVHEAVTFITPLAYYNLYDGWRIVAEDERSKYFPNNGKVARFPGDFPERKVNRLFRFRPERNQRLSSPGIISAADPKYSRYLTHSDLFQLSEPLAQVFNWTSRTNDFFSIVDLLSQGIPARDCLSHTIFLHYQDKIYGPLHLEPDSHDLQTLKPREYNQKSSLGGQPLLVNGFPFDIDQMVLMVGQTFLDQRRLGSPEHRADWSLPQMTMKRALRASKNVSLELQSKVRLVEREINELAALSASGGPEALHVEACVIQRAQYIVRQQVERLNGLHALIEELSEEHPLLVKARSIEIQRRKEKIEQECETEQNYLQGLQEKVKATQEDLARLYSEIQTTEQQKKQINADLETLEASLPGRLEKLREEMLSLFKDLRIPSVVSQTDERGIGYRAAPFEEVSTVYRQRYFRADEVTTISNPALPWGEIAAQHGMNARQVRICAAALLAGLIPALSNHALWQAVAQGIAGQRTWRVPVPLTATEPLALFGHISNERQSFIPAAGELADILVEALDHPGHLGLVVLDGIDRAPFLPVIEPLLRHYRTVRQHIQQFGGASPCQETLQLFHPRALAPEDTYRQLSWLAWPANLLLGVTFDDESLGSFPLPIAYTSWFAFVERMEIDKGKQGYWSGSRKSWQVPPASWYAWEQECAVRATHWNDLELPENVEPWQKIFSSAMEQFDVKRSLREIIEQLWS